MHHRIQRSAVSLGALAALAACVDGVTPVSPRGELVGEPTVSIVVNPPTQEELAAVAPSFGGFFLDASGSPTVYLGDAGDRGAVLGAMRPYLASRNLSDAALRVRPGEFSFDELSEWFDGANAAFDLAGVHMVDLDEARNRVMIGVDHPGAAGLVRATMARLGIPAGALLVEEREPVRTLTTLRDVVRPMGGGLQINFPGYVCTLGFNAIDGGQASFITNSHCTNTQGGVESTPYWQPSQTVSPTQVATEVEDPTYSKQNCPRNLRGRVCRNADASRALYASGATFTLGLIKKTDGVNNNSLTLADSDISIMAEDANRSTAVGTIVNKIGRTTGWTAGAVTATCVNTGVSGSNIVQLCQTHVQAGVAGGDSGSPAFTLSGNNATLVGILWGGGTSTFVYSPLQNIRQDLGNIQVRPLP